MTTLSDTLKKLPDQSGVYLMKDEHDTIIYVGKAKSLRSRVNSYFRQQKHDSAKTRMLVKKIADISYIITDTEAEALILENNLIKKHKPRYNISLKDDKTYPFIKVTREAFPRVVVTRNLKKDGSRYYGPYTSVAAMHDTVELLKRLFPFRSCSNTMFNNKRPCLNYHIKKCFAPCAGKISQEDYVEIIANIERFLKGQKQEVEKNLSKEMQEAAEALDFEKAARIRDKISAIQIVMEKQKIVSNRDQDQDVVGAFQRGDKTVFSVFFIRGGRILGRDHFLITAKATEDPQEMLEEFLKTYYLNKPNLPKEILVPYTVGDETLLGDILSVEAAHKVRLHVPVRGKNKELLDMVMKNARDYLENVVIKKEEEEKEALLQLQEALGLEQIPKRIECYDISNIQGAENVASMVVFTDGRPDKRAYRKFKIKSFSGADDFRSMEEVLGRRLAEAAKKNEKFLPLPDLMIVDGGKGQLSSAWKVLEDSGFSSDITLIALAKKEELIYTMNNKEPVVLPPQSVSLHLVQRIRDEAHRFAITYHRSLRTKRNIASVLDDIPGIGPKRKKILLAEFGSLRRMLEASEEEFLETKEIPQNTLKSVYNYLQSHEDLQMRINNGKKKE